ncbi:lysylphosphatidylglycerol synthase transmembrane domain-containing protein [Methylophaga sp. OBS4]|uniref:lysylphosphatidylglycerol synthase transmembrane domain-containing protein n=1 Tax=Methylophaga sp. OBS4 TaxID=2991935 RepID=UPI00225065BD|nr:lysylphosphatidylglycerol synthase transmembrane domain-containing protein [Methylophaga sp. OBS4]MCX4186945.1 flippase-like domain-containing protein [Methylophaga sp. OBS4]
MNAKWVLFAMVFIGLSAGVPYVIYTELDIQTAIFDARLFNATTVTTSLVLLFIYFISDGLRLYYVLRALGHTIPGNSLPTLVFMNILVSNITPMATGGGVAQILYLRRHKIHLGAATAATTIRTLLAMVFIFLPVPFLMVLFVPITQSALGGQPAIYLGSFAIFYLLIFAVVVIKTRWVLWLIDQIFLRLRRYNLITTKRLRRWRFKLRREAMRFSRALKVFLRAPKHDVLLSALFTILFLLTLFSFPAVLLHGLGYSVDYFQVLGLLVVTTFIMYFSPTPGASGIAEGVFGLFFVNLVTHADLVLTIIAWRFLTIHLGMLIGLPVTLVAMMGRKSGNV